MGLLFCTNKNCAGTIMLSKPIPFSGGYIPVAAFPCNVCGKLHWSDNTAVEDQNRGITEVYLVGKDLIYKKIEPSFVV